MPLGPTLWGWGGFSFKLDRRNYVSGVIGFGDGKWFVKVMRYAQAVICFVRVRFGFGRERGLLGRAGSRYSVKTRARVIWKLIISCIFFHNTVVNVFDNAMGSEC